MGGREKEKVGAWWWVWRNQDTHLEVISPLFYKYPNVFTGHYLFFLIDESLILRL